MVYIRVERAPVALTIAGSDSGGGAGIQADLKAFAALGVHGAVALTAVTAQNTRAVTGIYPLSPEAVVEQIRAVAEDIGVDAAKTGMLYSSGIIEAVAKEVSRLGIPLVVDPVMIAKSGARLLREDAAQALIEKLLPVARVVTPNLPEASAIVGWEVRSVEEAEKAAREISELGPEAVVVKGGHLTGKAAVDILYWRGSVYRFEAPRVEAKTTHGTGCCFSAAIAAMLARGASIPEAVRVAKEVVTAAIRHGVKVGGGSQPVNPLALLYKQSEMYSVLEEVRRAASLLSSRDFAPLVPEVGSNIAYALPYAESMEDVAAVPGRLRRAGDRVVGESPEFGASRHLSSYILTAREHDPSIRAALNIAYSPRAVEVLEEMELTVSSYDRRLEPREVKEREGATVPWGMREAIRKVGKVPDVVYHMGDWGKEPMIVLLGRSPLELAELALKLAERLSKPTG